MALPKLGLIEHLAALEPGQTLEVRFGDVIGALSIAAPLGDVAERAIRKFAEQHGCHLAWVWTDRHDPVFEKLPADDMA
jgi:hypothetical protein